MEERDLPPFTADEITGYLPGGWVLADPGRPGRWGEDGWRARILDGAGVERVFRIPEAEIRERGRFDALSRAVDELYREALRYNAAGPRRARR